jgi:hypothetical protein
MKKYTQETVVGIFVVIGLFAIASAVSGSAAP